MPTHPSAVTQKPGSTMNIVAMTKLSSMSPKALFRPIKG
jgi:hypothetical protein